MKRLLVFLAMTLLLTSCGGGGGNTVSAFETPTLTAYYVDAPVKGLIYEASPSGLNGVTDERGAFKFKQGDVVYLYLDPVNRIYIGKVKPVSEQKIFISSGEEVDSMVDATVLPFILFTFDTAPQSASFMDFTNLNFSQSTAEKIRLALRKESFQNFVQDQWSALISLQSEVSGYTFKHSGAGINETSFDQSINDTVRSFESLKFESKEFDGVYVLGVPRAKTFIRFEPNGVMKVMGDGVTIATATYRVSGGDLLYRYSDDPPASCDKSFEVKKSQPRWSLIMVSLSQSPSGCNDFSTQTRVFTKSKISGAVNVGLLAGKTLTLPVSGVCSFGMDKISFQISETGISSEAREFTMSSSICTNNIPVSGVVRNTAFPGVVVFENDNNIRSTKIFFSISDDGKSAYTTTSIQRAFPDTGFDRIYGAESVFTLK